MIGLNKYKNFFNFLSGFYLSLWLIDTYITYLLLKTGRVNEFNPIMANLFRYVDWAVFVYGLLILTIVYFGIRKLLEIKSPWRGLGICIFGVCLQSWVLWRNLNLLFEGN